ncbi:MAG: pilus assembly protein N-terminal domain-containing protein [Oscillospiraceae bacterium]|nr:pilus assembly protein N-terminal domain-containing protein [Oscillospiraceae bacterium]
MKNRLISVLLVLIMLFGMIPTTMAVSAEEMEAQQLTIDFQDSAARAAEQDFWPGLNAVTMADGSSAVRVGQAYGSQDAEQVVQAFDAMCQWLWENEGWTIEETLCGFTGKGGNLVYFSSDEILNWGLSHACYFLDHADGRSDLALMVDVPAEGWYNLNLEASLSNSKNTDYAVDGLGTSGGAYVDVIVNGETIYEEYSTVGEKKLVSSSLGQVYLREGENSVVLHTAKNYWAMTNSVYRTNVNLRSMTFTPLQGVETMEGMEVTVDLCSTYLPFDAEVTSDVYTVVCEDETVAAAAVENGGTLRITGLCEGATAVTVLKEDKELCTIEVTVSAPGAPAEGTRPIVLDFMSFARYASQQDWWGELDASNVENMRILGKVYGLGMNSDQYDTFKKVQTHLDENTCWNILEGNTKFSSSANGRRIFINNNPDYDYGIRFHPGMLTTADDRTSLILTVQAQAAGLYSMDLDVFNEAAGTKAVSGTVAGGVGNIYVNGEKIYDSYEFYSGHDTCHSAESTCFGKVYLNEGENVVEIEVYTTRNYTSDHYRAINLRSMTFTPLHPVQVAEETVLDLRTSYLAFDADVSALRVETANASIADADIDGGILTIMAGEVGETNLTVYKNTEKLCSIAVTSVENGPVACDFSRVWSEEFDAAVLEGAGSEETFAITLEEDGWYEPVLQVVKQPDGGKLHLYLDAYDLGEVNTYARETCVDEHTLRPVHLSAGEHTLRVVLTGANTIVTDATAMWKSLTFAKTQEPVLTISALGLSGKRSRTLETTICGSWDSGWGDTLQGAVWSVELSDETLAEAAVLPSDGKSMPVLQVVGLKPGEGTATVTCSLGGAEAKTQVPISISELVLTSFDVDIPCVTTGQIPRLAPQKLHFTMTANDGDSLTPDEVQITYAVSDESILQLDAENHIITGISDGTATVTVTAEQGGASFSKTLTFHVGDAGENLFDQESASFDGGEQGKWINLQGKDITDARAWSEIADDGTGNYALKITANPDTTDAAGRSTTLTFANGNMVKIQPGHLYELSFRMKAENYVEPEGAQNPWAITLQMYDYLGNTTSSSLLREYLAGVRVFADTLTDEYVEYTVPIQAPIDYKGDVYLVPRLTFNANSGYAPLNKELAGFEGTFWLDDFRLCEVGYETVTLTPAAGLNQIGVPTVVTMIPTTTTGKAIGLDKGVYEGNVTVHSTNKDVVSLGSSFGKTTINSYEYPTVSAQLVGLNAPAQIVAEMTIGDLTREGMLELSPTNLPNVLRDIVYTLDGASSAVLSVGQLAKGSVTGRTTQLDEIPEETIRAGGIYFTSADPQIASVDAVTGDVTCHNEGTTTVTAYVLLDGLTRKASATITVTDDTDLAAIAVTAPVSFLGTGGFVQLETTGTKASGVSADMSLYPVAWSLDEASVLDGIAEITEDGMLYGCKEGTVTVTATVSVLHRVLTAAMEVEVVPNKLLPGSSVFYNFSHGDAEGFMNFTVEEDGIALNREKTYLGGKELDVLAAGIQGVIPVGESMAFDLVIPKDGWYLVELRGGRTYAGAHAAGFVDDQYIGHIYFDVTNTTQYNNFGGKNTVYLQAGIHTFRLTTTYRSSGQQTLGGIRFYAVPNPIPLDVSLHAEKTTLVAGETQDVTLSVLTASLHRQTLMQVTEVPEHTNYYMISSSNEAVVSVSGMTLTAHAAGTAQIIALCSINGETVSVQLPVTVEGGRIAKAELTAKDTTVRPDAEPFPTELTLYGADGAELAEDVTAVYESNDLSVASIGIDGTITLTGSVGSSLISAKVTEEGRTLEASFWLSVTEGKLKPSIYTYEERENAQNNVLKYDWAWNEKEAAVNQADYYVQHLETIYNMWVREGFPRSNQVGYNGDTGYRYCRYCGEDIVALYGHYPWIVDPIENPWKITCPVCRRDFPSNDFASYYASGLDETGHFHPENADPQFLVNELYPEKGDGWGVDDGWGYVTGATDASGKPETHTYINYYMLAMIDGLGDSKHDMFTILDIIRDAYLYTGDDKYGNAGAILTDRLADIYPEYSLVSHENWSWYAPWSGSDGRGKLSYQTWDGSYGDSFAKAFDAFWPCMENEEVIAFLREHAALKGLTAEDITPTYVRKHIEDDLILGFFEAHKQWQAMGNFGMSQQSLAACAVAMDRLPESQQIVDYLFNTQQAGWENGKPYSTGGDVLRVIVNRVCRDGIGDEGSFQYNGIWTRDMLDTAQVLAGFDLVENADLWKNQKFFNMYLGMMRLTVCGHLTPQYGEAGFIQTTWGAYDRDQMLAAFIATGASELAKAVYAVNGNSVEGLRGDIFEADPEGVGTKILRIVEQEGQWDMSKSDLLAGHGMAILRKGPQIYTTGVNDEEFSDYNMYFGYTSTSHAQRELLRLDLEAFGLNLSGSMGYPLQVSGSDAMRMQWVQHTVSDNSVLVNDRGQLYVDEGGFPLHFEDGGKAKVMDVEASHAYEETDIYRRTVVTVEAPGGVDYAVDFFRVLGGSEHVYSFHGATGIDPAVTGLEMVKQPFGTYAGADVAFGYEGTGSEGALTGSGYNWLRNVSRDDAPDTTFTVDWQIKDFHNRLVTSAGIHLKLTMLSREPMTEVALAEGVPPQNGTNPDHLEYVLIRRSGEEGMDTLFTAVIEPYKFDPYIASSELVDAVLLSGTEGITDTVAAIKVTMQTGRIDYIVYATNPDCTYRIDDLFDFRGFTGVVSYEGGKITYAWGSEASRVADVIENAQAAVTGTVTDFTRGLSMDGYSITVEMEQPVTAEELTDRYIYVSNDGWENAVYPIRSAEVTGSTAVLDLGDKTLVRGYVDELDLGKGFQHNIAEGQTYTIPLSATFDITSLLNYTTNQVVKTGYRMDLQVGVDGSGMTYELEGSVQGMKFDPETGRITWTPSKTQIGRYPVAVKAVNKTSDTVATMEFVVYVVAYTGASYDPSACKHAKAIAYDVDGITETVCPACGLITKTGGEEEPEEKPIELIDIAGTNMNLGNELAVNFMFPKTLDTSKPYTAIITQTCQGKMVKTTEVKSSDWASFSNTLYKVTAKVRAMEMADELSIRIVDEEGNVYNNAYTTSVRAYGMKALAAASSTDEMKTLVVDMLNYGAEAQTKFSYNTGDLANKELTEAHKALATEEVVCTNGQVKGKNYVGTNLALEDKVELNLFFKDVTTDMYAEVSYTDFKGNVVSYIVDGEDFVLYTGTTYKVPVDKIVLADAFSPVTVTVYNADDTVHATGTDSVESYVARAAENALNEAIMKFAYSARNYLT